MKKPTLNGWLAIAGALAALILAGIAAFSDGVFTKEEATDLSNKTGELIDSVQEATADTEEAQP